MPMIESFDRSSKTCFSSFLPQPACGIHLCITEVWLRLWLSFQPKEVFVRNLNLSSSSFPCRMPKTKICQAVSWAFLLCLYVFSSRLSSKFISFNKLYGVCSPYLILVDNNSKNRCPCRCSWAHSFRLWPRRNHGSQPRDRCWSGYNALPYASGISSSKLRFQAGL